MPGPSTANDGVPVKPRLSASAVDRGHLAEDALALAVAVPPGDVGHPGALGDRGQELVGDVAGVLAALVAVEELDEVPAAALFAGGDRGGAGGRRFGADDRVVAEARASLRRCAPGFRSPAAALLPSSPCRPGTAGRRTRARSPWRSACRGPCRSAGCRRVPASPRRRPSMLLLSPPLLWLWLITISTATTARARKAGGAGQLDQRWRRSAAPACSSSRRRSSRRASLSLRPLIGSVPT